MKSQSWAWPRAVVRPPSPFQTLPRTCSLRSRPLAFRFPGACSLFRVTCCRLYLDYYFWDNINKSWNLLSTHPILGSLKYKHHERRQLIQSCWQSYEVAQFCSWGTRGPGCGVRTCVWPRWDSMSLNLRVLVLNSIKPPPLPFVSFKPLSKCHLFWEALPDHPS